MNYYDLIAPRVYDGAQMLSLLLFAYAVVGGHHQVHDGVHDAVQLVCVNRRLNVISRLGLLKMK